MKKFFKEAKTFLLTGLAAVGLALPAVAGTTFTGPASFQTTNNLASGVNYANYPTNAANIATGTAVDLDGYKTCGFYFQCSVSNNASAVVYLTLPRSWTTTQASQCTTNWETTPVYAVKITIPAMTNSFTYVTNLPEDFAGCANQCGIGTMTNSLASGQTITALNVGLIKKQVPTRFP